MKRYNVCFFGNGEEVMTLWNFTGSDLFCSTNSSQISMPFLQHFHSLHFTIVTPSSAWCWILLLNISMDSKQLWFLTLYISWRSFADWMTGSCSFIILQILQKWCYQMGRLVGAAFSWIPNQLICLLFWSPIQLLKSKSIWKTLKYLLPFSLFLG